MQVGKALCAQAVPIYGLSCCSDLLSGSRTSRLYSRLVQTGKAYSAQAVPTYPGDKHPNALLVYALPADNISLPQLDSMIEQEMQELVDKGPTESELQRIKKV